MDSAEVRKHVVQRKDRRSDEWKDCGEFATESDARAQVKIWQELMDDVLGPFQLIVRTETLVERWSA